MRKLATLTKRGKQTLRSGMDGMSAEDQLTLEVMAKIGEVEMENLLDVLVELVEHYGSDEAALVAVKSGKVGFGKA
jgi:hypothetical protein